MTKEEAKDIFLNGTGYDTDKEEMIDKIYDDFESRTCESCKYYVPKPTESFCDNEASIAYMLIGSLMKTDGCNKWEAKDATQ